MAPPTFVVVTGKSRRELPVSYKRFLENRLREQFGLDGTPVRIHIRRRGQKDR